MGWGYREIAWSEGMYESPRPNGFVLEHREVAAAALGRPLARIEHVHHEDENKANNAPANLYVFRTGADHNRFHMTGIRIDMGDGTWSSPGSRCVDCDTEINYSAAARCVPCWRIASRRAVRPSADELRQLVWSMPSTDVAKQFGVSSVAIGKWCRSLGVDKPPRGYWMKVAAAAKLT